MYGEKGNLRYIIGFAVVIVLLFVVIFMIVRGGGDKKGKVPDTQQTLTSYVNDPDVTISEHIVGPVQAVQTHTELNIDVTNQTTTASVSQGYDGNVTASKNYAMTPTSFSEFLSALDRAGFTKGNTDDSLKNDEGYCPTGQRYIFSIRKGGQMIERFWTTSCNNTPKTYRGNLSLTTSLFQSQVPDYDDLTENASFSSSLLGL